MVGVETFMPSAIASFLESEMEKRKWKRSELADRAGLDRSALTYILNTEGVIPGLDTLDLLAQALDLPLARLVNACGFSLRDADLARDEQIMVLLESIPELREAVGDLARLRSQDLRAARAYIAGMLHQRR